MYSLLHPGGFILIMSEIRVKQHPTLGILVCTDGHVMVPKNNKRKAHWTLGSKTKDGYLTVKIRNTTYRVHRLVAETFIPNPYNLPEVDHFPIRERSFNDYQNLRWADRTTQNRNTSKCDNVSNRGWKHTYEDKKQYNKEYNKSILEKHKDYQRNYYASNKEKCRKIGLDFYHSHKEQYKEYEAIRKKTRKRVLFNDGKTREISKECAESLLQLPVKNRVFDESFRWKPT